MKTICPICHNNLLERENYYKSKLEFCPVGERGDNHVCLVYSENNELVDFYLEFHNIYVQAYYKTNQTFFGKVKDKSKPFETTVISLCESLDVLNRLNKLQIYS